MLAYMFNYFPTARTCHALKDECKNVVKEMGFDKLLEISGVNISSTNWFLWMVENINVEDRTSSIYMW